MWEREREKERGGGERVSERRKKREKILSLISKDLLEEKKIRRTKLMLIQRTIGWINREETKKHGGENWKRRATRESKNDERWKKSCVAINRFAWRLKLGANTEDNTENKKYGHWWRRKIAWRRTCHMEYNFNWLACRICWRTKRDRIIDKEKEIDVGERRREKEWKNRGTSTGRKWNNTLYLSRFWQGKRNEMK